MERNAARVERNILYLINPISGTRGKSSLKELITRKTAGKGIPFHIQPTNAEGKYDFLIPVIEKEKITDIVVCGGDGTVSAVASALKGIDVRIGIIPMGSGNGLAFAAKIPEDPAKALDIVFMGKASPIDGFLVNGQFSCMLCGIGFDAAVAHDFARQPARGLQTYIKVTFAHFFKARPYPFRLRLIREEGKEQDVPVDAFFINIANGDQFGNHFTIAPKASLQDGLLDIVVVQKMGRWRMLFAVIRQVLGGYPLEDIRSGRGRKRKVLYFQAPSLIIENPGEAPIHIDGDPRETAPEFRIQVVPKVVQLILP